MKKGITKRVICLMLCMLIIVFTVFSDYQEVQAVVVADDILLITAALLYAAGVSYMGATTIKDASELAYSQGTSDFKNQLTTMASNVVNGVVSVSDSVWTTIRDYVQSQYSVGTATLTDTVVGKFNGYPDSQLDLSLYPYQCIVKNATNIYLYCSQQPMSATSTTITFYASWRTYRLASDTTSWISLNSSTLTTMSNPYSYTITSIEQTNNEIYTDNTFTTAYYAQNVDLSTKNYSIPYTGSDLLTNPSYDYKDTSGKREVGFPVSFDWLSGKTAEDVQNPVAPTPTTVPTTGEYTASLEGIKANTDTIAGQFGGTLDMNKIKVPADVIKNKFPFSIPWDLKNAITNLSAAPQVPKWTITFPEQYFVGGGTVEIDFTQFEPWAKIIRWGILMIFNIFLILATRKIIGA